MSDTDLELLARYSRHRSSRRNPMEAEADDAFAELVRRHLALLHSAALRQVRSPQLAEEVAQSTFLKLAQHARQLAPGTILSAWLYQVTRREAIDVVRREARRQLREQIATEMNAMNATAADCTHIEPLLDEAMHALDETDRAAVLLRYSVANPSTCIVFSPLPHRLEAELPTLQSYPYFALVWSIRSKSKLIDWLPSEEGFPSFANIRLRARHHLASKRPLGS